MTFGQMMMILRVRWKTAMSILVAFLLAGVALTLLLPKQYTASASLVVDVKPDPISMLAISGPMLPAFMATQIDILKSESVSRRVVKALRLTDNQTMRENWMKATEGRGNFESWVAALIQTGLDVKPARESNVINVAYKAPDANSAAAVANAYVQAYTDTVLDLRVDPAKQYSTFFDSRARQFKDQLEAAQSKLSAYQKQKGIVATDERVDVESARLNELSAQIVMVQALSAESGSRQSAARGEASDNLQDVLLNPLIAGLKSNLATQEARLQELNSRLGDNHPQVVEAKANIASVRARLQSEIGKVKSGVGVANSINRQREAEIRAAYEAQRQRVLRLKEQRDEATSILREVDTAQKAYDAVMVRLNQTALESQSNQTNISVLNRATEPARPSSPILLLNLIVAMFLGTISAIGTVLALESMNRKVRSISDLTSDLGLPVIGVMPGPDRQGWLGKKTQPLLARRVLGQLPSPNYRRA